jgi:hypothetical protein
MSIQQNFVNIKPSLNLDFANTKQLDPRITFARASTARFYDGKTTTKAEENLLTNSNDPASYFSNVDNVTKTTGAVAPDGSATAILLTETTANAEHRIYALAPSVSANATYTLSLHAKTNGVRYIGIEFRLSALNTVKYTFDIINGTVAGNNSVTTTTSATIVPAGNGWYRLIVTGVASANGPIVVGFENAPGNISYIGSTSNGCYLWGAQLEQRSFATAYTPTTTQPITNYIPVLQTAAAGTPRFDHNPVTGESLGLLIEEQRTNLLTYSNFLGGTNWVVNATFIGAALNSSIAPDGTQTASTITDTPSSGGHNISQSVSVTSGTTYTMTVYGKANSLNFIWLKFSDGVTNWGTTFNLVTGAVGATLSGFSAPTSTSITPVGNGWYRCSITTTAGATGSGGMDFGITTTSGLRVYVGTGQSAFIWGAQLEAGAFATSYIPTVASQVTRAADSASITGSNFSSWYNQNAWTLYAEAENRNGIENSTNYHFASISAGANANSQITRLSGDTNGLQTFGSNGGTANQWLLTTTTAIAKGAFAKTALGYALNDVGFTANAGTVLTDSLAQIPFQNVLNIGAAPTNVQLLNGCIKRLAYYPVRCTNTQLQSLTT